MESLITKLGLAASCAMPLFNIPMILHMVRRKSSSDISMTWLFGVWACILLMFPAAFLSPDIVFRVFGILNLVLFSAVVATACRYRRTGK